jgi:hypothetical protein
MKAFDYLWRQALFLKIKKKWNFYFERHHYIKNLLKIKTSYHAKSK